MKCLWSRLTLETRAICALGAAAAAKELPCRTQVAGMQLQKFKLLLEQPSPSAIYVSHKKDFLV